MEKLQAALERARKAREQTPGVDASPEPSVQPEDTPTAVVQPQPQGDRWAALTPFDVSDDHLHEHRVVTRVARAAATPFDILRTKALLQMRQNGWKRLAITSPMPRSGKTTMACNLALGLGRQSDLRAILMDMDLREPSVHEFFKMVPEHGIGEVLSGDVSFSEQALRIGDNVACCMARKAESDPTRLMLAEETMKVIERIEDDYEPDLMIFDLPSVLVNADTRAFLKNVDCALIVVRAHTTRYAQFDVTEREIAEQTNVLGTVLNAYTNTRSQDVNK